MAMREVAGALLLALAAVCVQLLVIFSTIVSTLNVPYYSLTGIANLLMASGILVFMLLFGQKRFEILTFGNGKWVFLRGCMGAAAAVFSLASVHAGAPIGDSSALGTVNIIVACLLGRLVLNEELKFLQIAAMIITVVGGVLITKPESIFGGESPQRGFGTGHPTSTPWAGYCLALASGISSGFLFVVSRKMQDISTLVVTTSVTCQEGTAFLVLALVGFFPEPPVFETVAHEPMKVVAALLVLLLLIFGSAASISAGATMCPAAASSTIYMFTSMTLGYIAQSILHHQVPDGITLSGAVLMLIAVLLMSWAQADKDAAQSESQEAAGDIEAAASDVNRDAESPAGSDFAPTLLVPRPRGQSALKSAGHTETVRHDRIAAFFCTEALGHFNPMLGVADGLVKQDWQVHFYCPKQVRQAVEGIGATWRHMGTEDLDIYQLAASVIEEDLSMELPKEVTSLPFTVVPATLGLLPYLQESVSELKPKFLAFDACAPWGSLLGQILQLPMVCSMGSLPMPMAERAVHSQSFSPLGQQVLDATAEKLKIRYGVDFDHNHSYTCYAPYTLITSSRAWHKGSDEFPETQFHYWGPIISERQGASSGDEAVARLLASDRTIGTTGRSLVYCSLGTVTTGPSFAKYGHAVVDYYGKLLKAAAALPHVIFVFAVGKAADLQEEVVTELAPNSTSFLGQLRVTHLFKQPVPENVVVARSVDQPALMEWVNVFVTHCGQNSCSEAMMHGVPVIAAPFFGDQTTNAARFEELGCGIVQCFLNSLEGGHGGFNPDLSLVSAESLAKSIRRVLEDPQLVKNIQTLKSCQDSECGQSLAQKIDMMLSAVQQQSAATHS